MEIYESVPVGVRFVRQNMTDDEACALEMERIALARLDPNCILVNKTKGGEPYHAFNPNQEYRDAMAERCRGEKNPNYGNHWSQEKRQDLSERLIAKGHSVGVKNPRCRRVMCVETGEIFDYMEFPAKRMGLKCGSSIWHAVAHPHRTAGGYHWVDSDNIERLNTPELRNEYLKNLPPNRKCKVIVPLDSDI